MEQYQLKAEELLYLAAKVGAEQLYGIRDVLIGMTEHERRLKLFEIEKNLSAKKYIQEDFDGNVEIEKQIKKAVFVCAFFESCFFMEGVQDGVQDFCYYFIKEQDIYSMKRLEEDIYEIRVVDAGTLKAKAHDVIKKEISSYESISEFLISMQEMDRITTLIKHGAAEQGREQFLEAGADEKIADAIIGAIDRKAEFQSLVFIEQSEERVQPYHVMFIQSDVLLKVEYRMKDYEDYMVFRAVDTSTIKDAIALGFQKLKLKETDNFI